MAKKIYVIDTSVCLTDASSITSFGLNDIVLPLKVLEEIDNHKKRQDSVGVNARETIRKLDGLREKGSLSKGIRLGKGKGVIYVKLCNREYIPEDLDLSIPDNEIIGVALNEKHENPRRKVIVVTRDINMRVKCDSLGLITEDFQSNQVVKDTTHIYTGFAEHLIDEPILDMFYNGEEIFIDKEERQLYPNQFVMLVSNQNEKKTAIAMFKDYNSPLIRINGKHKKGIWGVKPRNKEQIFALELLKDKKIDIITLVGKAGCGKTLLAIAAGLQQVVETEVYRRLVISRPIQPMGRDIGFLPGTMEEKMSPWVAPIQDNLQFLMGNDKATLEMYMDNGTIEVEALTYIRGRSISNAYIIIDEAQNLTSHELKTILTRVGENTKIVLTGDIEQIDNVYLDETSNGLTHAVEKFKDHSLSGHIILLKGERSKVATLASKIL
ncbi:MAG: putative PhoH-like protein [Prokaryotic dsDNA virus sp.]|nr:MAG: putative PhoH-like protein [Prokaryotic dsDNA virus sp.]|tara:strand:- start:13477 stop:14790 length:1314 start_codon:yes stop_codon:yes gene_type:complete